MRASTGIDVAPQQSPVGATPGMVCRRRGADRHGPRSPSEQGAPSVLASAPRLGAAAAQLPPGS